MMGGESAKEQIRQLQKGVRDVMNTCDVRLIIQPQLLAFTVTLKLFYIFEYVGTIYTFEITSCHLNTAPTVYTKCDFVLRVHR